VRDAIAALVAAGAPVVQLDEPWATTAEAATDTGRIRAVTTWGRLLDGIAGHVTLALPGGGAMALGSGVLAAAPFGSLLVDLVHGPDDWRAIARLPGERGLVLGVADTRRPAPDQVEVILWAARYAASMHGRGLARVGVAPASGLERLPREAAQSKLARLAHAARLAALPPDELRRHIDPRSIDARSAALGRYEPRRRDAGH
jgi:methionine synthase II (cobalamin-independent)